MVDPVERAGMCAPHARAMGASRTPSPCKGDENWLRRQQYASIPAPNTEGPSTLLRTAAAPLLQVPITRSVHSSKRLAPASVRALDYRPRRPTRRGGLDSISRLSPSRPRDPEIRTAQIHVTRVLGTNDRCLSTATLLGTDRILLFVGGINHLSAPRGCVLHN